MSLHDVNDGAKVQIIIGRNKQTSVKFGIKSRLFRYGHPKTTVCSEINAKLFTCGQDGQNGHLSKSISGCQNPPLYNKYFIFIYSEQMTQCENENDHFDLDHFDHIDHFHDLTKRYPIVDSTVHFIVFQKG